MLKFARCQSFLKEKDKNLLGFIFGPDNSKEVALSELKDRGYLLAVATNRDSNSLSFMLKEFGMLDLFDTFACIDQVKNESLIQK